jgi:PPOX class probable F420-dependent enzyme
MREGVAELFGTGRNFAGLATTLDDGAPHVVSVWTGVEGDHVVFFTSPSSRKGRNLARDPRVALTVVDLANPYRTARVRGTISEVFDGERATEVIDRISDRYTGQPFPVPGMSVYVVDSDSEAFIELPFEH